MDLDRICVTLTTSAAATSATTTLGPVTTTTSAASTSATTTLGPVTTTTSAAARTTAYYISNFSSNNNALACNKLVRKFMDS